MESELRGWLEGAKEVVVMGIGNPLRRDDFIGMKIVRGMKGRVPRRVHLLECESVPEGSAEDIADFTPTHVLVIDAALMGKPYGTARLIEDPGMSPSASSTHALPLQIFLGLLREMLRAKVALLAIQPKTVSYGKGLSAEVTATGNQLSEILVRVLSQ